MLINWISHFYNFPTLLLCPVHAGLLWGLIHKVKWIHIYYFHIYLWSNIFLSCRLPSRCPCLHCDNLYTTNSCIRVTYFISTDFASISLFIASRFFCLGLIWGLIHEIDRCKILSFSFFGKLCTIIPIILDSIYIFVLNLFITFHAILCK